MKPAGWETDVYDVSKLGVPISPAWASPVFPPLPGRERHVLQPSALLCDSYALALQGECLLVVPGHTLLPALIIPGSQRQ